MTAATMSHVLRREDLTRLPYIHPRNLLSDAFVAQFEGKEPNWGPFGKITYLRSYSQYLPDQMRYERWHETVRRVVEFSFALYQGHATHDALVAEAQELFRLIWNLQGFPAGRTLWTGGTPISYTQAGSAMNFNCAFTDLTRLSDFAEMVLLLMGGSGVGFRVTHDNVAAMNASTPFSADTSYPDVVISPDPYVGTPGAQEHTTVEYTHRPHGGPTRDLAFSAVITVGDSREGWASFTELYLRELVLNPRGVSQVIVQLQYVRPLGSALGTFGGHASGPQPLIDFAQNAWRVLRGEFDGQPFVWTDLKMLDLSNLIGAMVVAGGTRRSAQIALGEGDAFAQAKTGDWWTTTPWRAQSNNTVVFSGPEVPSAETLRRYFEALMQFGEPGFLNEYAAQRRRPEFRGINPCAEILLGNKGFCNLVTPVWSAFIQEDNGGKFLDTKRLLRALWLLTRHNLRVTNVDMSQVLPEWHDRQAKERLLGVSFTGFGDTVDALDMQPREQREVFRLMRDHVHQTAQRYAQEMDVPVPLLMTTVKPEGSLSTLAGVSSGLHAPYAPKYLRRVRVARVSAVAEAMRRAGFQPEPEFGQGSLDEASTWVFTFPVRTPAKRQSHEYTAIEQLERYHLIQNNWTDHNSSITVYIAPDEVEGVIEWLRAHWDAYVAVSFLPKNNTVYPLMPFEAVEDLPTMQGNVLDVETWLDAITLQGGVISDDLEGCESGSCPVR